MSSDKLVYLLQNAHAGERAAAFAYRGHALSVGPEEAAEIRKIENEEWEHRQELAKMLEQLAAGPRAHSRERGLENVHVRRDAHVGTVGA